MHFNHHFCIYSRISNEKHPIALPQYTRFSPAMAHRRLYANWQKNRDTTLRPDLEHFQTILFFADISGFTRLSERLSAEKLEMHTNNYFTLLIDVVVQYGGDIIKFCGDAVMVNEIVLIYFKKLINTCILLFFLMYNPFPSWGCRSSGLVI